MNTIHLRNQDETLELDELESWDSNDFDDLLDGFVESEQEMEFSWNDSFGLHTGHFH